MLLRLVAEAAPGIRVRFTTSHPKDMSDETLEVIAQVPNVCKHIHLPVQTGSSRILKLMNRKYTREWYLDRVAADQTYCARLRTYYRYIFRLPFRNGRRPPGITFVDGSLWL